MLGNIRKGRFKMKVKNDGEIYYINNLYYNFLECKTIYLLDSNIIIDLGKLYYNPKSVLHDKKIALINLVKDIKTNNIRIDYKYALTELSADRINGGVVDEKYKRLEKAMNKIFSMSFNKFKRHALYSDTANKANLDFEDFSDEPNMKQIINNTLKALIYSYTPLMKFYLLFEQYGDKEREKIFKEYVKFLHEEVGVVALYEIAVVIFYLFSSNEEFKNSQNLMKVNKQLGLIKKAWNVSWDLTHLRYINEISSRVLSMENVGESDGNYVLITKDVALANISKLLIVDTEIHFEKKYVPNAKIDKQQIKEKYWSTYEEVTNYYNSDEIRNERLIRAQTMDPLVYVRSLLALGQKLTDELLGKSSK